jgi:hypothetical protein
MKFYMEVITLKMTLIPYYFNSVASTFLKWRTFKLLRCLQLLNRLVDLDEILYGGHGVEYCLL